MTIHSKRDNQIKNFKVKKKSGNILIYSLGEKFVQIPKHFIFIHNFFGISGGSRCGGSDFAFLYYADYDYDDDENYYDSRGDFFLRMHENCEMCLHLIA